jgi:hypothetical protein
VRHTYVAASLGQLFAFICTKLRKLPSFGQNQERSLNLKPAH